MSYNLFSFLELENKDQGDWIDESYCVNDAIMLDNPDEMCISDDDDDGGNEDMKRLHDILDNDEKMSDIESDIASIDGNDESSPALGSTDDNLSDTSVDYILSRWIWDSELPSRLNTASMFLQKMCSILTELKPKCDEYTAEARLLKAQAGASTYKRSSIIGATVVGASRRLETIRACEPFAVLVEEACEVMEPTLMSVLAVKSLRKLELIGDHRQLPAFVQNCWYNLEVCTFFRYKCQTFFLIYFILL
jgi:AAA domain